MSNFSSDLAALQDLITELKRVFELLTEVRKRIGQLRETRRQFENTPVMSFDEWCQSMAHTYGHPVDRESENVKKQYDAYEDLTARKRDELRAQMERLRGTVKESVERLSGELQKVKNEEHKLDDRLRALQDVVARSKTELEHPAQQSTMEHLSSIERTIKDLHWMRDQF